MIVESEAREELLAAALWYDDQREGLGSDLLNLVDQVLTRVAEAPESFASDRFDTRVRRALVPRFPYTVVFVVHEQEVRIIAFAHAKRLPGYWLGRV